MRARRLRAREADRAEGRGPRGASVARHRARRLHPHLRDGAAGRKAHLEVDAGAVRRRLRPHRVVPLFAEASPSGARGGDVRDGGGADRHSEHDGRRRRRSGDVAAVRYEWCRPQRRRRPRRHSAVIARRDRRARELASLARRSRVGRSAYRERRLLRVDERELHSFSFAKKAAVHSTSQADRLRELLSEATRTAT